ncbi:hypothetical protein [Alloscardovia omnicolens]|uniref:hypothetical protein n=1 Tax=Alloscardovia omnicolens TaxID=419015 RepID=UPI003A5E4C39
MAESETITPPAENEPANEPPQQENPPTSDDLQVKYDELLKHSREWEKRAKQNFEAAQQLKELKKQNEELSPRASKADELQSKLDDINHRAELNELKSKVSKDTGVPAELLPDGDEETMTAYANKLSEWQLQRPRLPLSDQSKIPSITQDNGYRDIVRQFNN